MVFKQLYNACMHATGNDEHYCRQVYDELERLARERMIAYRDERGVGHIVVLPTSDDFIVKIHGEHDKSLDIELSNEKYIVSLRYVYNGQLKPVRATIISRQHVYMLNIYLSSKDILREIYARGETYDN
jgi:hypothetical protein